MSAVLVTGATGFVGAVVVARLLERSDRDVVCVVRGDEPEARLRAVLDDVLGLGPEERARVRAVAGNVTEPGVLTDGGVLDDVDTVVHCAAAIGFDLPLAEARHANVEGTRNVVALAGDRRLVHVSTAYVCGRRSGVVCEDDDVQVTAGPPRNTYEQTKREAEALLPPGAAIVRPSIVVGEAATGWTSAFNVLYVPMRALARGLLTTVPGGRDGRVDVVPVDAVADAVVTVATERRDVAGALHVVSGHAAVTIGDLAVLSSRVLGRPAPRFGEGDLGVYSPYLDVAATFDDTRPRAVLGDVVPPLEAYVEPLVRFAEDARWGRRAISRAAARTELAGTA